MSKGSKPRPVDQKKYAENYDRIFKAVKSFAKGQKKRKGPPTP